MCPLRFSINTKERLKIYYLREARCMVFLEVWRRLLNWGGIVSILHHGSRHHFSQFMGLSSCNRDKAAVWQLLWFAVLWGIWLCRNNYLFDQKEINLEELVEQIDFKAWTWMKAKVHGFGYLLSDWLTGPMACLGIWEYAWRKCSSWLSDVKLATSME